MARQVAPEKRLDRPFQLRLTQAQCELYAREAREKHLDLSSWMRAACDEKIARDREEALAAAGRQP